MTEKPELSQPPVGVFGFFRVSDRNWERKIGKSSKEFKAIYNKGSAKVSGS